jgi:hypothetical protein
VIENPCDFVCGGRDRSGRAEFGPHAPKELAEVTFRSAEGVGAHSERSRSPMLYLARFTPTGGAHDLIGNLPKAKPSKQEKQL